MCPRIRAASGIERLSQRGHCALAQKGSQLQASSESKHLFQIVICLVSSLLANMDLKDPETLASISNSIVRSPVPLPVKKLYQGEPMALGITQILIGILEISFGLVVAIAESPRVSHIIEDHFFTPYWMGFLYIISGSLSVAAAKDPKVPLVTNQFKTLVMGSDTMNWQTDARKQFWEIVF